MFFYTRYPSSVVLKNYFPDVRFDKLITAQLVKWFSNFREFFYQQIEKYARQCLAEGIRNVDDLIITPNSELYRVLNVHYNRSNQINVCLKFVVFFFCFQFALFVLFFFFSRFQRVSVRRLKQHYANFSWLFYNKKISNHRGRKASTKSCND